MTDTLFRRVDQEGDRNIPDLLVDYLVFHTDENGEVTALSTSVQNHSITLTRIPWWKSSAAFIALLAFAAGGMGLIVLSTLAVWLVRSFGDRRTPEETALLHRTRFPGALILSLLGAALCGLSFLASFFYVLFTTRPINLSYGLDDLGLDPFFSLPILSALLTVISAGLLARSWATRTAPPLARWLCALALLPLIVWVFIMWTGNLLTYYL